MTAAIPTDQDALPPLVEYLATLGWAVTHAPTIEAYRRSTGEDIAPALDRYREWLEENVIGHPGDVNDDDRAGGGSVSDSSRSGTGAGVFRRISLGN